LETAAATSPNAPLREGTLPATLLPVRTWVWIALLAGAFCWVFENWLRVQAIWSWGEKEDWGHSFLMPVLSMYLLWQNRARILATPASTFWPGVLPLLLGIVCYFYFIVGVPNHMLQGYSMILTLAGVSLFLAGPRLFRHLFIPIAMLVFAVKIAQQVMEKATFPLQLLASKGAWYVLRVIGVLTGDAFTVDVAGNTLEVTRGGTVHPLNVAEACSGMRMVIAFAALAATVGLFSCRHWWQRVALLLMAVPVALFMNTLRVAVLGLLTMVDKNLATGDAHMLIGTLLLVPGLFLFLGVVSLLNKFLLPAPSREGSKGAPA
jgi:exosortase